MPVVVVQIEVLDARIGRVLGSYLGAVCAPNPRADNRSL